MRRIVGGARCGLEPFVYRGLLVATRAVRSSGALASFPVATRGAVAAAVPAATAARAQGDCVDCNLCVEVCPAGIDIRNGLQYECISCGLCIDACDRVMLKSRQPTGLIRFASQQGADWRDTLRQPRVKVYAAFLGLTLLGVAMTAALRVPLQVEVVRDRGVMARQLRNGDVENIYRVHIQNYDTQAHTYDIQVESDAGLYLPSTQPVHIASGEERTLAVSVVQPYRADAPAQASAIIPLTFNVRAQTGPGQQRSRSSSFMAPR